MQNLRYPVRRAEFFLVRASLASHYEIYYLYRYQIDM